MNFSTIGINEAISIVIDRLKRLHYRKIQYIPVNRIRSHPGREILILHSFLFEDQITMFKGSILQPFYEKILRNKEFNLYLMYRFFLKGEELFRNTLLEFFNEEEFCILNDTRIISCTNNRCKSNYKFIPIDDMIIAGSPDSECDTAGYVYIGEDSIVFNNILKQEIKKCVINALEIGCGTGFLSLSIAKLAQNVTAVDINPRALEFSELNARINGIDNLVTNISDVYSTIHGQFDLIISNPPYVFLPPECSGRIFAFGGDLGIEILEKILLGLDNHLSNDGICYMIFFSYIKDDSTNTALELIKNIFYGKSYSISLKQIDYHPLKSYPSFYKNQGVSYAIRYILKIQKSPSYNLTHIKIEGFNKVLEKIKIRL